MKSYEINIIERWVVRAAITVEANSPDKALRKAAHLAGGMNDEQFKPLEVEERICETLINGEIHELFC